MSIIHKPILNGDLFLELSQPEGQNVIAGYLSVSTGTRSVEVTIGASSQDCQTVKTKNTAMQNWATTMHNQTILSKAESPDEM